MKRLSIWYLSAFYGLVAAVPAMAGQIAVTPSADVAFAYSSAPPFRQNFINGGKAPLCASVHTGVDRGACSLLRFDLSKMPPNAKVKSAKLILFPEFDYPAASFDNSNRLMVYLLDPENADWEEGEGDSLRNPESDPIVAPGANGTYVNMTAWRSEGDHDGTRWLSGKTIGRADFGAEAGSYALADLGLAKGMPIEIPLEGAVVEKLRSDEKMGRAGLVLWMTTEENPVGTSHFAIFQSREGENAPELVVEF